MSAAQIRRLQAQLDRLEPAMRQAVTAALTTVKDKATTRAIVTAVERGDAVSLRLVLATLPKELAKAAGIASNAFDAGGRAASIAVKTSFQKANPFVVRAAEQSAAQLVTRVSDETRQAIRVIVSESVKGGLSPREAASLIKQTIGLTERQAMAVMRRRALNTAKGWKAERVAADADKYAAKLLKQRAETIARTEIIRASTEGQLTAWQDAINRGHLSAQSQKVWIVTPDDRLCPVCAPLDGAVRPMGAVFQTSAGAVSGPPVHPRCRCALGLQTARASKRQAA